MISVRTFVNAQHRVLATFVQRRNEYAVSLLTSFFLLFTLAAAHDGRTVNPQFPPSYIPSGQEMYKQFCAACHGADGKGDGPAASNLKTRPSDLTTLAKRHEGSFHTITFQRSYALVQRFLLRLVEHAHLGTHF